MKIGEPRPDNIIGDEAGVSGGKKRRKGGPKRKGEPDSLVAELNGILSTPAKPNPKVDEAIPPSAEPAIPTREPITQGDVIEANDLDMKIARANSAIELGDKDGAREILRGLVGQGNDVQMGETMRLLDIIENDGAIFGKGAGAVMEQNAATEVQKPKSEFLNEAKTNALFKAEQNATTAEAASELAQGEQKTGLKENEREVTIEKLKSILRSVLESNSGITGVTRLNIDPVSGGLKLDIEIETSGGDATITGLVANEGHSLALNDLKVDAGWFIESSVKNGFMGLVPEVKKYFQKQYAEPISSIQVTNSGLMIKLETPATPTADPYEWQKTMNREFDDVFGGGGPEAIYNPIKALKVVSRFMELQNEQSMNFQSGDKIAIAATEKKFQDFLAEQRSAVLIKNSEASEKENSPDTLAPGFIENGTDKVSELEARVNVAREALIAEERRVTLPGVEQDEKYEQAKQAYEKARAELVGSQINSFLESETKLADARILEGTEKKPGAWEKISGAWKWLGDQNLEKLGWKPEGKFKRTIARGINARMGIGAALLGVGFLAPPVFFLTLGAKRAMSGVGAAVFTGDWLRARKESALTTINAEELKNIKLNELKERMGEMVVGLRMQGKLASESADFKKLTAKYEEILKYEAKKYETIADDLGRESDSIRRRFEFAQRLENFDAKGRGVASALAGALASVGLDAARYLSGAQNAGLFSPAKAPIDHNPIRPITKVPLPPPGYAEGIMKPDAPPAVSGAEAPAGQPPAGASAQEANENKVPKTETAGNDAKAGNAAETRKTGEAVAKAGAPELEIPKSFEITIQPGEGPIHEARKAISEYIAISGDEDFAKLTKAQRILAEEKLYRAVKDSLPPMSEWKAGVTVSFNSDTVMKTLAEVSAQTSDEVAALDKNLEQFVDKVKWPRYDVEVSEDGSVKGAWESDEGIRHVSNTTAAVTENAPTEEARLDELTLSGEEENYVPDDIDGEGDVRVDELILQNEEVAKAEALLKTDPTFAQPILEEARHAQEAALDSAVERTTKKISGLYLGEYDSIKNIKISDVLKKGYFGTTPETSWLSAGGPNAVDVMRKMKLRDNFMSVMEAFSPAEKARASGMTIHQFIQGYYKDRIFKGSII